MAKNWLKEAIKNVDINDDIAILENPEVSRYLDGLMIARIGLLFFSH
jgi:hypothetical protein